MNQAHCSRCGRALTDPFSIAIGMGPECCGRLSKRGWSFPKPKYRVRAGHVELVKVIGKIEPPPVQEAEGKMQKRKVRREVNGESS